MGREGNARRQTAENTVMVDIYSVEDLFCVRCWCYFKNFTCISLNSCDNWNAGTTISSFIDDETEMPIG